MNANHSKKGEMNTKVSKNLNIQLESVLYIYWVPLLFCSHL